MTGLVDAYLAVFGRRRFRQWHRFLFNLSTRGLGVRDGDAFAQKGEDWFMKVCLSGLTRPVVFDVGANEGLYAARILATAGDAQVHCFEPHPRTFARLRRRLGDRVQANPTAVGAREGSITLYDDATLDGSTGATTVPHFFEEIYHLPTQSFEVPIIRLEDYCRDRQVQGIDLLKVDVEGGELAVLQGLGACLDPGFVRSIQFEFNSMNIVNRIFFKDFWDLLAPRYRIHRLVRDGAVRIKHYATLECELFEFQNLLAVSRDLY